MDSRELVAVAFRSFSESFPAASCLVNVWNELRAQRESERIEAFLSDLGRRVARLENGVLRNDAEWRRYSTVRQSTWLEILTQKRSRFTPGA
jgi:hypothetical protein